MAAGAAFGTGTGTLLVDATLTTNNAGTLDTATALSFGGTLTDTGTLNIATGILELTGLSNSVSSTGKLDIASGATLDLDGTLTMAAGAAFGTGTGTLLVDGTLTTNNAGPLHSATALSFGGTLTDTGPLNIATGI